MFVTAVIFTTYFAYIEIGYTISEKRWADEWDLLCMVWYHFSYSVPQSWTTDIWDLAQRGSDIQAEISRCIAGNNSLALRPGLLLSCCLNPVFLNRYFAWRTSNYEFVWEKHILQYVWKRVRDQYREQCFKTHREISQKTTRNIYAVEKFCKYLKFGWYTTGLSPY